VRPHSVYLPARRDFQWESSARRQARRWGGVRCSARRAVRVCRRSEWCAFRQLFGPSTALEWNSGESQYEDPTAFIPRSQCGYYNTCPRCTNRPRALAVRIEGGRLVQITPLLSARRSRPASSAFRGGGRHRESSPTRHFLGPRRIGSIRPFEDAPGMSPCNRVVNARSTKQRRTLPSCAMLGPIVRSMRVVASSHRSRQSLRRLP